MRPQKRVLVLSPAERQLALHGLLQFRNKLVQQYRYPDAVNELIENLYVARRCRRG